MKMIVLFKMALRNKAAMDQIINDIKITLTVIIKILEVRLFYTCVYVLPSLCCF